MGVPRVPLALFVLAATALPPAQSQTPSVDAVLAAARTVLGGEARLSAVKTFVATGRTRQVRGENLVPIEFEIAIELPDKYVRKDEIPAQESGPTTVGFRGDELIQTPAPALRPAAQQGRPGGPPTPTPEQLAAASRARVVGVKQDFARLMLGLFAGSFSSYPLTFAYAGQAEAPQGMADVLEVKGQSNLAMRLFVYKDTHLPVMVSWQTAGPDAGRGPGPGARGSAPDARGRAPDTPGSAPDPRGGQVTLPVSPGAGPPPGRAAGPGQAAETRIYFADYRETDGLRWPFRLRRASGTDTVEETTFDRYRINVRIDAKKFEIPK